MDAQGPPILTPVTLVAPKSGSQSPSGWKYISSLDRSGADPGFWKRGGAWGVGDKLACTLKACPLGTFEILDAFSCNLVHILSKKNFFLPIFCR